MLTVTEPQRVEVWDARGLLSLAWFRCVVAICRFIGHQEAVLFMLTDKTNKSAITSNEEQAPLLALLVSHNTGAPLLTGYFLGLR